MDELQSTLANIDRRRLLQFGAAGLGGMALADLSASEQAPERQAHHRARARRVIYLFQSGGPSQVDLFDHKPALAKHHGEDIFKLVEKQGRLTGFTNQHKAHPVIASKYRFAQHGENGAWVSELLPHMSKTTDQWCTLRGVGTIPVNSEADRIRVERFDEAHVNHRRV